MATARLDFTAAVLLLSIAAPAPGAAAELARGSFVFSSARNCAASGRFPAEVCAFAETNAAAEFEEKAPRFPQRALCEQIYGAGGCSLGFVGADGWVGKKTAVFFSPRQRGFRVTARSERDVTVTPMAGDLQFVTRSALRRDASINPKAARATTAHGGGAFGVSSPDGPAGPTPPHAPVDPNFDCAAVLEPTDKGDPASGCAPMRARR
ncbi:DUF1190 domain-containing protein [Methylosinus sp. H3A]|uniref:DUF1190 domain-containing protein n=1 Tax=Methylosinus sp. H3A TaxID=2785786 RepID=UPI0018C1D57B|nr:DUF1190 domain-containing protein [Methylosinus sp. H3A]MBG0811716.1 DUF1190 domain-containing protein [Methylosinus sp. H3A]